MSKPRWDKKKPAPGRMYLTQQEIDRIGRVNGVLLRKYDAVLWEMNEIGHPMRPTEGFRTQARQNALYAQGRTRSGPIVTWTLTSRHTQGRAIDSVFVVPRTGGISWTGPWDEFGRRAVRRGLVWGGNWVRSKDRPHVEI